MEPIVLLDTNVVLARCLDPAMDAKGKLAEDVFQILSEEKVRARITESLAREFETTLHSRVGQITDVIRRLQREPAPQIVPGKSSLEVMEEVFSRLRSESPDAAGALQLLETRLAKEVEATSEITQDSWRDMLTVVLAETTVLLAEVQRRFDIAGIEVVRQPGSLDHERFRDIIPRTDLDHMASAARLAQARGSRVVFVTLDSPLHAAREKISKVEPGLIVTTPTYLRRQIQSARTGP